MLLGIQMKLQKKISNSNITRFKFEYIMKRGKNIIVNTLENYTLKDSLHNKSNS